MAVSGDFSMIETTLVRIVMMLIAAFLTWVYVSKVLNRPLAFVDAVMGIAIAEVVLDILLALPNLSKYLTARELLL